MEREVEREITAAPPKPRPAALVAPKEAAPRASSKAKQPRGMDTVSRHPLPSAPPTPIRTTPSRPDASTLSLSLIPTPTHPSTSFAPPDRWTRRS